MRAAILAVLLAIAAPAAAQELLIGGQAGQPRTLALAELQAMPAATVDLEDRTAPGTERVRWSGPLLWALVQAAQPVDAAGRGAPLQHTLLARGRDGYAVALAIGEIDPRMEGKPVLVAVARDGQPLPTLPLVVPGDAHAGRSVRDLVAIDIR